MYNVGERRARLYRDVGQSAFADVILRSFQRLDTRRIIVGRPVDVSADRIRLQFIGSRRHQQM
jgi:hypothetical protein